MQGCVFCEIADGSIPARIVYEDDVMVAFEDINPRAPSHVLLIPRRHIESLNEARPEHGSLLGRMLVAAGEVARQAGIAQSGWRLVANCGPDSGQEVPHLHFHILGGRRLGWPPG
jgi:histidine triad (HIT) family protein